MLRPDLQLEKKEGKFSAKTRKEKDETTSIAVEIISMIVINEDVKGGLLSERSGQFFYLPKNIPFFYPRLV